MANIKINETIIKNVNITDSGDLIGLNFVTNMNLVMLDNLFTPATSPEIRIVDEAGHAIALYKNRKLITLRVDASEAGNVINMALQVTPAELKEAEILDNKIEEQAAKIAEQEATNASQASVIEEQQAQIAAQETEISNMKTALTDAEAKIVESEAALAETQDNLAATQAVNDMLMECVLEMSEVVYA